MKIMDNHLTNIHINIASLFYKHGICNVCISPGLRNTALSLSFIEHGKFNCYSIVDERSSGYFALGMALKTNIPTVLITLALKPPAIPLSEETATNKVFLIGRLSNMGNILRSISGRIELIVSLIDFE